MIGNETTQVIESTWVQIVGGGGALLAFARWLARRYERAEDDGEKSRTQLATFQEARIAEQAARIEQLETEAAEARARRDADQAAIAELRVRVAQLEKENP